MPPETTETVETTESDAQDFGSNSEIEVDVMESQGIKAPTEAELRGDEEDTETETEETEVTEKTDSEEETEETEDPEKTTEVKKEEEKPKEETKSTEKTAPSEPQDKPPKGFVPLSAIHEVRGENRYLKEQIQTLQNQMSSLIKPEEKATELDDFEVLTDEQFEDLAEDNPSQAAVYLRKLNVYEAKQRSEAEHERQQQAFTEQYESIIESSVAEIEKVAPGIYDEGSEVQKEILEFAEDFGFTEDMYYLTNPSTKIILPGESEPLLLGEQAASVLGMLVNAKAKMSEKPSIDEDTLRAEITKEITAELTKKFKTNAGSNYRDINSLPKSDKDVPNDEGLEGKVLSTKEFDKLSSADKERYLAGE